MVFHSDAIYGVTNRRQVLTAGLVAHFSHIRRSSGRNEITLKFTSDTRQKYNYNNIGPRFLVIAQNYFGVVFTAVRAVVACRRMLAFFFRWYEFSIIWNISSLH